MASEMQVVHTMKDAHGRTVKIGTRGDRAEIVVTPHSGHDGRIHIAPRPQHEFMQAIREAFRRVNGEPPTSGWPTSRPCCDHCDNSEATGHGYGEIPHDGPCSECEAEREERRDGE
jgi:hypothetical protein